MTRRMLTEAKTGFADATLAVSLMRFVASIARSNAEIVSCRRSCRLEVVSMVETRSCHEETVWRAGCEE